MFWEPETPRELGEGLATIVNDLPWKVQGWFLTNLWKSEGGRIQETLDTAVDLHYSMYPAGAATLPLDHDEEDEVPAHYRDFRSSLVKRPDIAMTAKVSSDQMRRADGLLPTGTNELTAIAYAYGKGVPQKQIGTVWNRALSLMGDTLNAPTYLYEPEPVGYYPEGQDGNLGHALTGERGENDPITPKAAQRSSKFLSETKMTASLKDIQDVFDIPSAAAAQQQVGRAAGKFRMMMSPEAIADVEDLRGFAITEYVDIGEEMGVFEPDEAEEMRAEPEVVSELDTFRTFFSLGFIHPLYLNHMKEVVRPAVSKVLRNGGADESLIKKTEGALQTGQFYGADDIDDRIKRTVSGLRSGSDRKLRAALELPLDDSFAWATERWNKLSSKKIQQIFEKALTGGDE
jgi:hypothetical protein